MTAYRAAWAGLGLAALGIEGVALFNRGRGDTLSEIVWDGLDRWPHGRALLAGAVAWLAVHWLMHDSPAQVREYGQAQAST